MMTTQPSSKVLKFVVATLVLTFCGILALVVWQIPLKPGALAVEAIAKVPLSGVENPVTAVLLNFRGYDTLLEVAVLLLVVIGVWGLGNEQHRYEDENSRLNSPMVAAMIPIVFPLIIMMAGYMVWVGAHRPGGAFQGGTIMAAIGVLLSLTGRVYDTRRESYLSLRLGLVFGITVFIVVATTVTVGSSNKFLQYPPRSAHALMLVIECCLTISIALILVFLFIRKPSIRISEGENN